jgi:hypothetical protein
MLNEIGPDLYETPDTNNLMPPIHMVVISITRRYSSLRSLLNQLTDVWSIVRSVAGRVSRTRRLSTGGVQLYER